MVPAETEPQLAASQTRAVAGEDFMATNVVRGRPIISYRRCYRDVGVDE